MNERVNSTRQNAHVIFVVFVREQFIHVRRTLHHKIFLQLFPRIAQKVQLIPFRQSSQTHLLKRVNYNRHEYIQHKKQYDHIVRRVDYGRQQRIQPIYVA